MRLDVFLKESGMVNSRTKAQELIKTSNIKVDSVICVDVKKEVSAQNKIEIINNIKYVGRGGEKLEHALEYFDIKVKDKVCLDIGSSTGGFTDCLLQSDILEVYCVDVGTLQLDIKIKNNIKVKTFEKTDIRNFGKDTESNKNIYFEFFDLVVCDVSFISITKIVENIFELLKEGGVGVILIKPQFEVEKKDLSKGGILKDENKKLEVIENIKKVFTENNLKVINIIPSPIHGGDGNQEFLMHIQK